jgi:hypothetical protein
LQNPYWFITQARCFLQFLFFLQFHFCLQLGCRNESFEEEGQITTMLKKHPDAFHIGGGMLTF